MAGAGEEKEGVCHTPQKETLPLLEIASQMTSVSPESTSMVEGCGGGAGKDPEVLVHNIMQKQKQTKHKQANQTKPSNQQKTNKQTNKTTTKQTNKTAPKLKTCQVSVQFVTSHPSHSQAPEKSSLRSSSREAVQIHSPRSRNDEEVGLTIECILKSWWIYYSSTC